MGIPSRNCVVAFARIVGSITSDATDLLVRSDLIEKVGKYGRISDAAARDLNRPYLQCFLIDPDVDLAPEAAFGAAMLSGVPLTFALGLDAGAVYQKVQRPRRTPEWNGNRQRLLSPAQRAEIRHRPVQPDQFQQAFHKPGRLPQGQPEQHFEPPRVYRRLQSKQRWSLWKKVTEQTDIRLKCAHAQFG